MQATVGHNSPSLCGEGRSRGPCGAACAGAGRDEPAAEEETAEGISMTRPAASSAGPVRGIWKPGGWPVGFRYYRELGFLAHGSSYSLPSPRLGPGLIGGPVGGLIGGPIGGLVGHSKFVFSLRNSLISEFGSTIGSWTGWGSGWGS